MHKQEMELQKYVCTSFHFCELFTVHWIGRTSFLSSEMIFFLILFYFNLFFSRLSSKLFNHPFVVFFHNELQHTHKQEMELQTCVCTSFHFCQLLTDYWIGRTSFLSSEIIILFYFILSYFSWSPWDISRWHFVYTQADKPADRKLHEPVYSVASQLKRSSEV